MIRPRNYALSFYGFIDLLAILPTYASVVFVGSQSFAVIRVVRILRVFRVLKLVQFLGEANRLKEAMRASGRKVFVFLLAVSTLVIIIGAVMYYVEGEASGFTSIPESVYWAIVTMTTVGYGDITPQDRAREVLLGDRDDRRVRDHRGAHGHRHRRTRANGARRDVDPGMSCMPRRGPPSGCRVLSAVWKPTQRGNRCLKMPPPRSNGWRSPRIGCPRYTGMQVDDFGDYILLTNFKTYVTRFADQFGCDVHGEDRPMQAATNAAGLSIVNFGIGSANAALIMDLLIARRPKGVLFLGKCGGLKDSSEIGHFISAHRRDPR